MAKAYPTEIVHGSLDWLLLCVSVHLGAAPCPCIMQYLPGGGVDWQLL